MSRRTIRLRVAGVAVLSGLLLAGAPLVSAGDTRGIQAGVAGIALLALVATLTFWRGGLAWTIGAMAAVYAIGLRQLGSAIDPSAPLEATALLLLAELVAWSSECRSVAADQTAVVRWRLCRLAVLGAATLAGGWLLVAASDLPSYGGVAMAGVGMASAVALVGLATVTSGSRQHGRQSRT